MTYHLLQESTVWFAVLLAVYKIVHPVCAQLYPIPGEEHLYPYGPDAGDITLERRDDSSSEMIFLDMPIMFFGVLQPYMWVCCLTALHVGMLPLCKLYYLYRNPNSTITT